MAVYVIIYGRYSDPRNQHEDSLEQQERKGRTGLEQRGIDHTNALFIKDGGIRGDNLNDRAGYDRILELVKQGNSVILIVDQQGRFSRGLNVKELVQDIVFHGGRFIAIGEAYRRSSPAGAQGAAASS
jgi:DNA invertase Pin-like site-specific DNA recombinase